MGTRSEHLLLGCAGLPYPELLYCNQYLGVTLYLEEPAVGTRHHELRPRLRADAMFRTSITPEVAFDILHKLRHSGRAWAGRLVKWLGAGVCTISQRRWIYRFSPVVPQVETRILAQF